MKIPFTLLTGCFIMVLSGCDNGPLTEEKLTANPEGEVLGMNAINASVEEADVQFFMAAGDVHSLDEDGNVILCSDDHPCALEPGTEYHPNPGSLSRLYRGADRIGYSLRATGLPPGAYTNWWVIFNHPEFCINPEACVFDDLFNPDVNVSVFWATGAVVPETGIGKFIARTRASSLPGGDDQVVFGEGLEPGQAAHAHVHLIIKYHGPASDDPDVLMDQLTTLTGHCDQGVNGFMDELTGTIQCFDPQFVEHVPMHH